MIYYVESLKKSPKTLLEKITEFSKGNPQKSIIFMCTGNEELETEFFKKGLQ